MEGLIPYFYRAIVQQRSSTETIYGALASSSFGEDSGRFYIQLPPDSGRFASDLLAEVIQSPHPIYRSPTTQCASSSNNSVSNKKEGHSEGCMSTNNNAGALPRHATAVGQHVKSS